MHLSCFDSIRVPPGMRETLPPRPHVRVGEFRCHSEMHSSHKVLGISVENAWTPSLIHIYLLCFESA